MESDVYKANGFKDRLTYLEHLAREFDVPMMMVKKAAVILGPDEDFDGLLVALNDYSVER